MADNKQHDTHTARRPDCVTEIRMGNSVLVVSGYFKKDTTTTAADKMARVLEAEAAATQDRPIRREPGHEKSGHAGERGRYSSVTKTISPSWYISIIHSWCSRADVRYPLI